MRKMLKVADMVLDKLKIRVESLDPMEMNPQALKHITGVMKDLKDIQSEKDAQADAGHITVIFTGELEDYSG